MKKIKLIAVLVVLLVILGAAIAVNTYTTVIAEVATGAAQDTNEHLYWVTAGVGGENRIPCTKEQYDNYTGSDFGRTDTLFVVIYERKVLIPYGQKVIQVKKLKVDWNEGIHKRIIPDKTYYRLVQEEYTSINNSKSVLIRLYECYPSDGSQMRLTADNIVTPFFENINAAKDWIDQNTGFLRLKPLTIVGEPVMEKWKLEGYTPSSEYTADSPEGLTYEELVKH